MKVSQEEYTRVANLYFDTFNKGFPTYEYWGSRDDIYRLMLEAIEKGEPVRLTYTPGVTY